MTCGPINESYFDVDDDLITKVLLVYQANCLRPRLVTPKI
jgi:hypothetical protein